MTVAAVGFLFLLLTRLPCDDVDRRYIRFATPISESTCDISHHSHARRNDSLRIMVSFVHFENENMSACELANKRNNLAVFLLSAVSTSSEVLFVFTFPGRRPEPLDVLHTAGILPESVSGKTIASYLTSQQKNVELHESVAYPFAPDLCHHHAVILGQIRKRQSFDYVMILNDGVRGPFFDTESIAETERALPYPHTPPWLVRFLMHMLNDNSTRLVGPFLSCERDIHVQGWTQLIDWRSISIVLPSLKATCEPGIDWDSAIDKEVALSTNLLSEGYSVAGFYPGCKAFGEKHRTKLLHGMPEIFEELGWCKNLMRADVSNFLEQLSSPDSFGFFKFGGTMWRDGLLSKRFVDLVHVETSRRFGIADSPSCYRQQKFVNRGF